MDYRLLLFVILFPILCIGQKTSALNKEAEPHFGFNDCWGAINMEPNASKSIRLKGNSGKTPELQNYFPEEELNSVWVKCEMDTTGFLSITLEEIDFSFHYVAFLMNKNKDCRAFEKEKLTPVQHGKIKKQHPLVFLIDSLQVEKNQKLVLCLNALDQTKSKFSIITSFNQQGNNKSRADLKNIQDFRSDKKEEAFQIKIRDAISNAPVNAKVIIAETRNYNALYQASDFVFPLKNNLKMQLKIDAQDYFPKDKAVSSRFIEGQELIIELTPIAKNQLIELEGLEFVAQSNVLLPEAYPKLRRLKDFMTTNETVEIEIQGHVHALGKNTFKAKRLSRKRARKVKNYLIDSGIDRSRMDIVGFGNSKMKYPTAENEIQIQQNRRVEIRIK